MSPREDGGAPGPRIDPERLAALLDGRLSDTERDAVLAQLGVSADDIEVLADALAVETELSGGSAAGPSVVPITSRRRINPVWWIALAAGVVLIVVPVVRRNRGGPVDISQFASIVARDSLPVAWTEQGSVVTRGAAANAPSARLGVLAADLRIASSRDSASARRIAASVAAVLGGIPQASAAAKKFDDLAAGRIAISAAAADSANAAIVQLHPLVDRDVFTGAAWLRAAWLASAAHDAAFFDASGSRRMAASVDRISGRTTFTGAWQLAHSGRWDELSAQLLQGLVALGR